MTNESSLLLYYKQYQTIILKKSPEGKYSAISRKISDNSKDIELLEEESREISDEYLYIDDPLPEAFFVTAEWLVDDLTEILATFILIFQNTVQKVNHNNDDVKIEENPSFITIGVCLSIIYWIKRIPAHFDENTQLSNLVKRLKDLAITHEISLSIIQLLDTSIIPSFEWLRCASIKSPVSRQVSLVFHNCEAESLATAISHIDYKALCRVTTNDLKNYVKTGKIDHIDKLQKSVALFNNISNWIQWMILSKNTAKSRSETISKVTEIAKELLKSKNYNSLMAVVGGISHSNINRLHKTQALISTDVKKEINKMTMLLSMHSNFSEYRRNLKKDKENFVIPIMGVHLKDLIQLNTLGGIDFSKTRQITLRRLFQLKDVLSKFPGISKNYHNLNDANIELINTLKISFDMSYNEDEFNKTIVFAEWASGVNSVPDKDSIQRHTAAMVEAVFKHYDHDKDSSISAEEFQEIADGNGRISKTELFNYFMDFNSKSIKLRIEFRHNFHETTFLTPTICANCNKVLWGLIRQGYKCKDCHQAVHSYCKDIVVMECKHKQVSNTSFSPVSNLLQKTTTNTDNVKNNNNEENLQIMGKLPNDKLNRLSKISLQDMFDINDKSRKSNRMRSNSKWKARTVSTVSETGSTTPGTPDRMSINEFKHLESTDEPSENINDNESDNKYSDTKIETSKPYAPSFLSNDKQSCYQSDLVENHVKSNTATLACEESFEIE
ncbi:Guanine-nucleotide dissociation stimulator CDC25 domain and EF-hand domain and Protein kinase C-like, phorbol ester/diacylglycerol binding domain and EF-hand domain pair and Diacylglycerol/phorbol-ester binding domain and Ras guanine nucleotide exchange factor, domain-containing protein [Strongyloides ratti]|uniref:Ras guanyl-releasing protein 3 n=1 Tax=Strongyloides ratti TaxID=34506 RepID=A0A090L118_STRRB|nr:Guanine-nucleotide dissociation stimulator CDC25 domain and EF-hand domain and Protein kinase C-like, phorbol ester/diacylglycerol binding domain and EF-hand domain pair and Diacylglycerol/phorbol-ester binding domain and Ras guanine nucleotide exchange factor, domain-containing protein [Strongyloides ratti]CEF63480.1 Guanine-nucleotide dissociation stimulator CDC25 domain and EF-hand domain and Protein kinase C-like, phorbol ester/diacylglycerol binding domain and EF-hand domain pair and Diacy